MDEITARAIRYAVDDHPPAAGERAPTPRDKIRGVLRKFLGDGLLAYITYSIVFVANFNSGTNSMQTGRMILLCIAAAEPGTPDVNRDAVRLIGVVVLTAICLLQFFSPAIGRALNKGFAVVKILFLIALFLVAAAANAHPMTTPDGAMVDRAPDWATWHETGSKLYFAKALLAVLFAFEGWENATFVSRTHIGSGLHHPAASRETNTIGFLPPGNGRDPQKTPARPALRVCACRHHSWHPLRAGCGHVCE